MIGGDAVEREDLEREPDGMPHMVIGLTILVAALLAMLTIAILWVDALWAQIGILVVAAFAFPMLIGRLQRKATRDRDHVHPSR